MLSGDMTAKMCSIVVFPATTMLSFAEGLRPVFKDFFYK